MLNENIRVMLIEDNEGLGSMYSYKLTIDGLIVSHYDNGIPALKDIGKFNPHIVIVDLMIAGMDGLHTIAAIRKLPLFQKVPILTFSNLSNETIIEKSKALGSNDYLNKSNTTPKQLLSKIKEMLKIPE